MDENKLSYRLQRVAEYVPQNSRLADIGSDHAYLPAYLALKKQIEMAIAGEVVKGPYLNAKKEVKDNNLENIIDVRLADGLDAIEINDKINVITICGMGGPLIRQILENGKDKLINHPRLILQANVGESNVRQWLMDNHYKIVSEEILEEDNHIYEIIVADYTKKNMSLTETDLKFGPYLKQSKNEIFIKKWEKELQKIQKVRQELTKAKNLPQEKLDDLDLQEKIIGDVLND